MIVRKLFPVVSLFANLAGSPALAQTPSAAPPHAVGAPPERTMEQNRRVAVSWDSPAQRPAQAAPPPAGPGEPQPGAARR